MLSVADPENPLGGDPNNILLGTFVIYIANFTGGPGP